MAYVTQDSELMTTYKAEVSHLAAKGKFQSFRDGSLHPALLTESNENKVLAVVADPKTGQRFAHDAVDFFGLPNSIIDFEVRQYEDTMSFVFATTSGSSCDLHLFHKIASDELWDIPESKKFRGSIPKPKKMFLSDNTDVDDLPSLFYTYPRPGSPQEVLLHPVTIDPNQRSLTSNDAWTLTGNITDVLDVAAGVCDQGKGAFVLYKGYRENERYLQFRNDVLTGEDQFCVDIAVHAGHNCLAAYTDPDTACSVLLLAGQRIDMYTNDNYLFEDGDPAATIREATAITTLHVAQNEDDITIWYTDEAEAAYYYNTTHSDFTNGVLIQFLPKGAGRTVCGMPREHSEQDTVIQTLTTTNDDGYYTLWQQSLSTGFWDPLPFHVDTPSATTTMSAYSVRFRAHLPAGDHAVADCEMEVTTSGVQQIYANGKAVMIGPNPTWLKSDSNGVLNLQIPSQEITCHEIQVSALRPSGKDAIHIDMGAFDPAHKVAAKVAEIQTVDDLWNARTHDGEPLIPKGSITQDMAVAVASGIQNGMKAHASFVGSSSVAKAPRLVKRRPRHVKFGFFDWVDKLLDLGNKILDLGEKALEGFKAELQKLDDSLPDGPWKLIVHLFEEPFEFLIDTAVSALKAVQFILSVVQKVWDTIQAWAGLVFDWKDIKQTTYSIKTWFDSSFDWATGEIDNLEGVVDKYCDEFTKQIANVPTPSGSYSPDTVKQESDPKLTGLRHGVQYNWGFDALMQVTNIPGFSLKSLSATRAEVDEVALASDVFDQIQRLVSDIGDTAKAVFGDVSDRFSEDMSTAEIFQRITSDLLQGIVKVAADVIHILLAAIKDLITTIKRWADTVFNIPIISDVWKWLTDEDLSFSGVISFVLAIPVNLLSKALTGRKPPDMTGLTKHSWDTHILHPSQAARLNFDAEELAYFGQIVATTGEDMQDLAKGTRTVLDAVEAATVFDIVANVNLFDMIILDAKFLTKVPPIFPPWKETRKKTENYVIYGTGVIDTAFLAVVIGARAATGIPHEVAAMVQSIGSLACTISDTTCRVIIGIDELSYEETFAVFHFIEAAFGVIDSGASLVAAGANVAKQDEVSFPAGVVSKVAFGCFIITKITELAYKYDPTKK